MIARVWHSRGKSRFAAGSRRCPRSQFLRRPFGGEVEFVTVMWFDSLDAVKAFAGGDYETAYVPASARGVLSRFDAASQHCDLQETRRPA
jgi:hypothetical protein